MIIPFITDFDLIMMVKHNIYDSLTELKTMRQTMKLEDGHTSKVEIERCESEEIRYRAARHKKGS